MKKNSNLQAIDVRYSELSQKSCCLSCGGAVNYSRPQPGEVCIDLGSGRGTDVFRLAETVGEKGFVYGIDVSEGMIEKANRTAEKLGIKNVAFLKNELEDIPLGNSFVDLVVSNCTIAGIVAAKELSFPWENQVLPF